MSIVEPNGKRITNVLLIKSSLPLNEVQMRQSFTDLDKILGLNRLERLNGKLIKFVQISDQRKDL